MLQWSSEGFGKKYNLELHVSDRGDCGRGRNVRESWYKD